MSTTGAGSVSARIFISYKRNVEPDEPLARTVSAALNRKHQVFIDQEMKIGTLWAQEIEKQIRESDFLVVFLSPHSVQSEMVKGEVEHARRYASEQSGKPCILPIRVSYREPLPYPLSAYLDPIQTAFWDDERNTESLIEELTKALTSGRFEEKANASAHQPDPGGESNLLQPLPAAQPINVRLETPEGTMPVESPFYVERATDQAALSAIESEGVTITIKGARQMGKSSLLNRVMTRATQCGKRVAFLDFQLFGREARSNAETFMREFCFWLTDTLEVDDEIDKHWTRALSLPQRCTRYMARYLLPRVGGPLVLAMDEVDGILDAPFRNEFFAMLRSWHNARATTPSWKSLDLVLVISTEPYQLIADLNQSPFNVGEVINLDDFTEQQAAELNIRHGTPYAAGSFSKLVALVGGHPYLLRRALYLVAARRYASAPDLLNHALDDQGPFGDHLRHHLFRLHDKKELIQGLLQVIKFNTCTDEKIFFRLRGAGLVRREDTSVVPRCQIYADYFPARLNA